MESIYLWPDRPALSLLVLWLISAVALWAARDAMLQLIERLGKSLEEALEAGGRWCKTSAETLRKRSRSALLAAGGLELQAKLEKEFHRIETGFSDRLGQYSALHRNLDELLQRLDADYQQSGASPPEVPGWAPAVESIAGIPAADDPNVHKILEGVRKSLDEAQRKALHAYRADTAERHEILDRMRPLWKEVRALLARMSEAVSAALETASRVNAYIDEYSRVRNDDHAAARALTYSATKLFATSLLVLGVALGGALVATISALVIVLMEVAVGIFVMDLLGITELFPKLARIPTNRRRMLLGVAMGGLFFLAAVESSLAVLREMIVEAEAALKLSLAGENASILAASSSRIPVVGQAALGFVLPWIVAMVAIPLEMLFDSGRHVGAYLVALFVSGLGSVAFVLCRAFRTLTSALPSLYDVYISIPLRIERAVRGSREGGKPSARRAEAKLKVREEGAA